MKRTSAGPVVAVIQARMGSTRLPGKILLPLGSSCSLDHMINRLRRVKDIDRIVVATSTRRADDQVAARAGTRGVDVVRGSESDVLSRFVKALKTEPEAIVLRLTADCPLVDPAIVTRAIRAFCAPGTRADYLSNALRRSYPRGYDVEVFRAATLLEAGDRARLALEREHVTPYIYRRPKRFRIAHLMRPDPLATSEWRLTLDTPEDYALLRVLFRELEPADPAFGLRAVERFIRRYPFLLAINAHVQQTQLAPVKRR